MNTNTSTHPPGLTASAFLTASVFFAATLVSGALALTGVAATTFLGTAAGAALPAPPKRLKALDVAAGFALGAGAFTVALDEEEEEEPSVWALA
jgi:hypothetical protein